MGSDAELLQFCRRRICHLSVGGLVRVSFLRLMAAASSGPLLDLRTLGDRETGRSQGRDRSDYEDGVSHGVRRWRGADSVGKLYGNPFALWALRITKSLFIKEGGLG
jgi:hypothetical protein